jgi:hypothetical protein
MLLAITKKELERIETMIAPTLIRERYENKIDWLFSGLYCLIVLAIFVGIFCTDIALPNSLFLAFLLFTPTAMLVIAISKPIKKYLIEHKDFCAKSIREAMTDRLKSFYLPSNNVELLKTLYERSLLKRDQKEQIAHFLAKNSKTIVDYLKSLGDENLLLMAKPYREQMNKDINEAVESYFIGKSRDLELQIMAENSRKSDEEKFKEDSLKFFYSTMPKNMASQKEKLCY